MSFVHLGRSSAVENATSCVANRWVFCILVLNDRLTQTWVAWSILLSTPLLQSKMRLKDLPTGRNKTRLWKTSILTLSRATSQFCTTRDFIEWARSQFCTISKSRLARAVAYGLGETLVIFIVAWSYACSVLSEKPIAPAVLQKTCRLCTSVDRHDRRPSKTLYRV